MNYNSFGDFLIDIISLGKRRQKKVSRPKPHSVIFFYPKSGIRYIFPKELVVYKNIITKFRD
jgi:hypothetical protein